VRDTIASRCCHSSCVDNKDYPEIAADFARTFQILRALPCDVFLGAHGGYYGMIQKFEKSKSGTAKNPFIDPEGYRAYVELKEKAFRDTLTAQQTTKSDEFRSLTAKDAKSAKKIDTISKHILY
jgi:hypothetical protein